MRFGTDGRLAWAIALASVILWAATASATFGSLWQQETDPSTAPDLAGQALGGAEPAEIPTCQPQETPAEQSDPLQQQTDTASEPAPLPTADEPRPEASPTDLSNPGAGLPASQPTQQGSAGGEATFRLCGGPDPQAERAIEQLIDGRSFRARLVSRGDGCAELTITVLPQSSAGALIGRQSTQLTLSVGSGNVLSIRIATKNGVTKASIGATT